MNEGHLKFLAKGLNPKQGPLIRGSIWLIFLLTILENLLSIEQKDSKFYDFRVSRQTVFYMDLQPNQVSGLYLFSESFQYVSPDFIQPKINADVKFNI